MMRFLSPRFCTIALAAATAFCDRPVPPPAEASDPFLDTLQLATFRFFWEQTDPNTGLTPDRWPTRTFSSVAAIGFGLTAYAIGAERGYVTRDQAAGRTLQTLKYLYRLPQGSAPEGTAGYQGFYYHFLDYESGTRFNADIELSTMDTGLLMAGALFSQSYFNGDGRIERSIRALADSLYRRVNWQWARTRPPLIALGWRPERGFDPSDWRGYNEAMIVYLLALGSPDFPLEPEAWTEWTKTYVRGEYLGQDFVNFGPLFGHQFSHCWIDFRGIRDRYMRELGIDYFENSRRATLTHQAYGEWNPRRYRAYADTIWGWTACDGPGDTSFAIGGMQRRFISYGARGVSVDWVFDDGTIAPAAAGGSMPFAPDNCLQALKAMKSKFGDSVWGEYGFYDAFNPTFVTAGTSPLGWFDDDYLGIDQGPLLIMAENFRSGLVWEIMKKNPYVVTGLRRAGFSGGWLDRVP